MRRGVRLVLALFAAFGAGGAALWADEWPQWRGPEGLGVSAATDLPERWGPESDNLRWRVELPGAGISSPIVSGDRVFLTTAYEGRGSAVRDRVLRGALVALAVALAWLVLRARRRGLATLAALDAAAGKRERRRLRWVVGLSLFFALVAVLMALEPELFLEAGNPGRSWRAGGTLALLGLAVAIGWLRPAGSKRLVASIALLALTGYVAAHIPAGPKGPASLDKALIAVFPGLVGGLWGLVTHWRARRRVPGSSASGLSALWPAPALVAMALLIFVPPNFLSGLQRVVLAVDVASGELLWERPVFRAPAEQKWPRSSYATPTAAADGERLFAYFGSGLAALDYEGKVLWTRKFADYVGHTRYGAGASPVLTEDSVILFRESEMYVDPTPSWMASFDKETGEVNWRHEPADMRDSYSTPLLVPTPDGTQLVASSWKQLLAFDPGSGERLWSFPYPMWQLVATMARDGDRLAVTGGAHGDKTVMVVRAPAPGAEAELLWESSRTVADVPSPVIYRGGLYTVTSGGVLTSYGLDTGEVLWRKRLDGEHYASLVAGDGKVYATSTEGRTTVIEAAPEYREIGVNESAEGVYASPAIADGGLLIRSATELFFIEGPGE